MTSEEFLADPVCYKQLQGSMFRYCLHGMEQADRSLCLYKLLICQLSVVFLKLEKDGDSFAIKKSTGNKLIETKIN